MKDQVTSTNNNSLDTYEAAKVGSTESALLAEVEALRDRLAELEDLEVQRLTEEQERFDSLNVLDEYAQQLEESRDKLARLLQAGVAIEEARTTHQILQNVANAVGAAGWASAVVYLFEDFEIIEAAYNGVCDEDRRELERNRRPANERARMYSQDYDEFKVSRSYFVPAERLHEVIQSQYIVPGRREVMPGDDWDPLDLAYVPMYSSTGKVIGSINCDDPVNGKRPSAEVFQYLEIFADLAARKIETVRLLNRQAEIEAKLRASEKLYRTVFDRSADSFILMDDLFRECNEATLRTFGCDRDDIVGHSPLEFSPKFQRNGERSDKLASEYIASARDGSPQSFEWLHLRKDGTELDCEVSLGAIDVGDRPMIMAIVRDVSERKRAAHDKETAAIASQLFLSSRTPDLVYSQLPKILVSRFGVSAAAIEIYDAAADEMILVGEDGTGLPLGFRVPLSMSFTGTATRTGEAIVDLQVGRRADFAHADLRRTGMQSIACVPLRVRDQAIGVIWLGDVRVLPNMAQFAMPLQVIANYLAQAIDRYRAEEEMADLKHFFESLLDNLPAQVCVYDSSGNYRYANRATADDDWLAEWIVGRNDGEVAARRGWPEPIGEQRMSALAQAVSNRRLIRFEESLRDSSDRERYFLRMMSPVEDDHGNIDHVIGYGLDITDTKLWEQEQRLLLQLPTDNPNPVLSCHSDGSIIYMNSAVMKLAESATDGLPERLLPADHSTIVSELIANNQSGKQCTVDLGARRLHWTYSLTHSNQVHVYGIDLSGVEYSAQQRVADRVTPSSEEYSRILGNAAWVIDKLGRVNWLTAGAQRLAAEIGISSVVELLGMDLWTRAVSLQLEDDSIDQETQREGRAWHWSIRLLEGGRILVQLDDLTELRGLQDKLRHAQRLESVGRLAGGVAHDFNNLLTGIMGNLELLENRHGGEEEDRSCIRDAARAAERASSLVKQLLNYTRKSGSRQRAIDPNIVCESVARMLSRTIDRRIQVQSELSPDVWQIYADPNQLEQILMNLGVNAADAIQERRAGTSDDGEDYKIVIRTGNTTSRLVREGQTNSQLSDCIAISVEDNGCGMSPQIKGRIFDAFFTTKSEQQGTGLGLAIVSEIVGLLGGVVEVNSEAGRGSVFTIFLPRAENSRQIGIDAPARRQELQAGGSETILLVDDESVIIELGREVLEHRGYRVITAFDGPEAIEKFRAQIGEIDLVIVDLCLPRMGGEELIARMLAERPEIPVILSSGLPESESRYRNINLGSIAFIQKPYRPSELLTAVREVLDHSKP